MANGYSVEDSTSFKRGFKYVHRKNKQFLVPDFSLNRFFD